MTGVTDEIRAAIEQADGMPPGRARIAVLDQLLTRLEGSPDEGRLGVAVRLALIPACLYGGEHQRVGELLDWVLARCDESPAWLGPRERRRVLFSFGWATVGLLQHPDVPLSRIEADLTEMAARYAATAEPSAPVERARFHLTRHVLGAAAASEPFEAWRAAAHGSLAECAHCGRAEQVRQLATLGFDEVAVALALPVLDDAPTPACPVHPVATISAVLASLLATGQAGRAAREHVRAVRLIRARPDDGLHTDLHTDAGRADQLLLCARSGQLQRGLDLIEEWLPWYSTAAPPTLRLRTATAIGRTLRGLAEAGHGGLVVSAVGVDPVTVDELGARLTREARDLGARFDSRNGTSAVGDDLEQIIDAPPLPELPLARLLRAPRTSRTSGTAGTGSGAERSFPAGRRARRGRRAVAPAVAVAAGADDPTALAKAFDAALAADSEARRTAALDTWRALRTDADPVEPTEGRADDADHPRDLGDPDHPGGPDYLGDPVDPGDEERAAARLDGWLAIEDGDPVASHAAALRLRAAGLIIEALLHEQTFLLGAAEAGRLEPGPALERVERLAIAVAESAGPGEAGLALSRLVLMREVAAGAGDPAWSAPESAGDPLEAALATLDSVPSRALDHQQLRARARLLRLRAVDEPPEAAVESLRRAVETLPDGIRPLERALAGADLAAALHENSPAAALAAWDRAVTDATSASADEVLASLLAAGAALHHSLGDPESAVADLSRAVPLLDLHSTPVLAAQARLDLSRALLNTGSPFEAAEAAESALADLTDLMGQALEGDIGPERHLAGCAAFAAAEAMAAGGEPASAHELAEVSAQWHRENGNPIAGAEAWQLAAGLTASPVQGAADLETAARLAEQGGDWPRAATCRRERAIALKDAVGVEAAIAALDDVVTVLDGAMEAPAGRHAPPQAQELAHRQLSWHRVAVADQRARLLAVGGQFAEAMTAAEGLDERYRELGDAWSARDLVGLLGLLRAELGDFEGARADLERAAIEAQVAGDRAQAHGLGERLAAVLDQAGRKSEAEAAYDRFST